MGYSFVKIKIFSRIVGIFLCMFVFRDYFVLIWDDVSCFWGDVSFRVWYIGIEVECDEDLFCLM